MRTTIDASGRLVIPKALRDRLGIRPGPVLLLPDGAGLRIEPLSDETVTEEDGRLIVPPGGAVVGDDLVQALRAADQR